MKQKLYNQETKTRRSVHSTSGRRGKTTGKKGIDVETEKPEIKRLKGEKEEHYLIKDHGVRNVVGWGMSVHVGVRALI